MAQRHIIHCVLFERWFLDIEQLQTLPGWQPKENASQLPQEGELSKQRGWHQCTKGRGPKNPGAQEVKGVAAPLGVALWAYERNSVAADPSDTALRRRITFSGYAVFTFLYSWRSSWPRCGSTIDGARCRESCLEGSSFVS